VVKSQLKNDDAVICESSQQWERIRSLAIAAGLKPAPAEYEEWGAWTHSYDHGIQGWRRANASAHGKLMPEYEFVAKMFGVWSADPVIAIGDRTVKFMDGGDIKVGCTSVSYDTLKQIYEHAATKR